MKLKISKWKLERKLTFEDRKKIKELHATGVSANQLAKTYKVDHTTIRYHLRNIEKVARAPRVNVDKIIQLYREGKNFTEIAELVKCAKNTATCHIKKSKYYDPKRKIVRRYKIKTLTFSDCQKKELERVKKQIQCKHPSFKCGICKKWYDNLREQIIPHDRPDC